jgi:malonyl-CoA O-methyltransferase
MKLSVIDSELILKNKGASMNPRSNNETAYDQWSSTYDTGLNSTVAVDDFSFPSLWKAIRNQRVLEIGSGTGRHTVRLANQGNQVVGIDLSSGMLDLARKRTQGSSVELIHGNFLEFSQEQISKGTLFDAALAALVLEHIRELDAFFQKTAGLLIPGAPFFVSEIHPSRAKKGRLAHFLDASTHQEVWLDSVAHEERKIEEAAMRSGFHLVQSLDALGTPDLLNKNPDWAKYVGVPMVKLWEFRRGQGD